MRLGLTAPPAQPKLVHVSWAAISIALVLVGVAYLLVIMRGIDRTRDELSYYRLSVRFWVGLAALGVVLAASFAHPIYRFFEAGRVAWLTIGLVGLPFSVVVLAGLRNASTLLRAHLRRRAVVGRGLSVEGRVVSRSRRVFQDIMAVVVEADLPDPRPSPELAYRPRDPAHSIRYRFVECCPADHWNRFEPGRKVVLEVDPQQPDRFAIRLFGRSKPRTRGTRPAEGRPMNVDVNLAAT